MDFRNFLKSVLRNKLLLILCILICIGLLEGMYVFTKDEHSDDGRENGYIYSESYLILPGDAQDDTLVNDMVALSRSDSIKQKIAIFLGKDDLKFYDEQVRVYPLAGSNTIIFTYESAHSYEEAKAVVDMVSADTLELSRGLLHVTSMEKIGSSIALNEAPKTVSAYSAIDLIKYGMGGILGGFVIAVLIQILSDYFSNKIKTIYDARALSEAYVFTQNELMPEMIIQYCKQNGIEKLAILSTRGDESVRDQLSAAADLCVRSLNSKDIFTLGTDALLLVINKNTDINAFISIKSHLNLMSADPIFSVYVEI